MNKLLNKLLYFAVGAGIVYFVYAFLRPSGLVRAVGVLFGV